MGDIVNEQNTRNQFIVIKLLICLSVILYSISNEVKPFWSIGLEWLLVAVFVFVTIGLELQESKKWIWLSLSLLVIAIMAYYNGLGAIAPWAIIVYLDCVAYWDRNFWISGLCYLTLFQTEVSTSNLFMFCSLLLVIYYQNTIVIRKCNDYINSSAKEEYELKEDMDLQRQIFKKEMEKRNLYSENKILEDRETLFQQLHDRLGHSINGSVYQLEAAKVLIEQKPEESKYIIQGVIDHLRGSMDEIRVIFRKEKPSKKQLAIIQIVSLCEECREKYGIEAQFKIEGDEKRIPDKVVEIILDNTYEAVSNALKYSKCTQIRITIHVMNQRIRCDIQDNGRGCERIEDGMGIQGMKNRMRAVNGFLNIQGEAGFEIMMLFPIELEGGRDGTN